MLRLLGGILDAPGSTIRNIASLRSPTAGLFDLERRITGRSLIEKLGLPANTPGLDTTDVLGFLAEVGLDPLTYLSFGASAATKSGRAARMAGIMPKGAGDALTGRLRIVTDPKTQEITEFTGRRFLSRVRTLSDQIGNATQAQREQAAIAAQQMGTSLDDLIRSGEPLQRDVAVGVPFGPTLGEFSLPGGKKTAMIADYLANRLRISPVGTMASRLFDKSSRTATTFPVQNAMRGATQDIEAEKLRGRQFATATRQVAERAGMSSTEYRRFMRGVVEQVDPENLEAHAATVADSVAKHLPQRLRTPEAIKEWTDRVEYLRKDVDADMRDMLERSGRAPPMTKQVRTKYFHRTATDFPKRTLEGVTKEAEIGARKFVDFPGGANLIDDAMQDTELWEMVNKGYRENNVLAEPRAAQLESLTDMDVEDLGDLTRNQAGKMIRQGTQEGRIPSRTQAPPDVYKKEVPDEARALIATRYFKWSPDTLKAFQAAKLVRKDKLDDAGKAILDAYEDQWEQAGMLAKSVGARKEELVRSKTPYFGNDPLVDWMEHREHTLEQSQYAIKLYELYAQSARRIGALEDRGSYDAVLDKALAESGFVGELPRGEIPEGYVPLKDALLEVVTPLGAKKKPGSWNSSVNMSYAIKAIAPHLRDRRVIDPAVFERMAGDHAVYQSGIDKMRAGAGAMRAVAGSMDELNELAMKQVLHYDGLLDLNRIFVPKSIVDDASRVMDTLADRGFMRSILKGYDKVLNLTKGHLTVNFPGFHVRNAYNMFWQMIVSGSYDPSFSKWDPRAYLNPLREAGKLIRGEYVENAAKYFPGQKLTNDQALDRLREMAFSHNTASGQYIFHSEASDVAGRVGSPTIPDLLTHMAGTIPEGKPGPLGLGYLWEGWKKLWKGGPGERNPLNTFGVNATEGGPLFGPYGGGVKTATYVESIGRTATMMARMKQGWAPDLAAAASNAAHVDYNSLSVFERQVMKRVIPFYSYASRMVPWTLKNLAEHPGGLTAQTIRAFERAKGQGGFVPDYLQGSLSIPVGGVGDDGKQTFVTGLDLPFESLNDYVQYGPDALSTVGRTLRQAGGQLNPLLQAPIELAMGQTFYQGRNLRDLDPALGRILANITGQEDPVMKTGLLDQVLMKSPASRYISTLRQLTDMRDPLVEQAIKKPLHTLTGVRFKDVNMEQQTNFAVLDAIKEQVRGDRPFVTGDYITVKKENLPKLSDRQKRLLELYRERSKRLRQGA